jgi:hypothetical protein
MRVAAFKLCGLGAFLLQIWMYSEYSKYEIGICGTYSFYMLLGVLCTQECNSCDHKWTVASTCSLYLIGVSVHDANYDIPVRCTGVLYSEYW